jgi:hypothetical protein
MDSNINIVSAGIKAVATYILNFEATYRQLT